MTHMIYEKRSEMKNLQKIHMKTLKMSNEDRHFKVSIVSPVNVNEMPRQLLNLFN